MSKEKELEFMPPSLPEVEICTTIISEKLAGARYKAQYAPDGSAEELEAAKDCAGLAGKAGLKDIWDICRFIPDSKPVFFEQMAAVIKKKGLEKILADAWVKQHPAFHCSPLRDFVYPKEREERLQQLLAQNQFEGQEPVHG